MRDFHHIVIDDISEMVSRISVTFHDNLIVNAIIVEHYFPMNQVTMLCLALWNKHTDHIWLACSDSLFDFVFAESNAKAIIFYLLMPSVALLFPHLLETVRSAEAVICFLVLN